VLEIFPHSALQPYSENMDPPNSKAPIVRITHQPKASHDIPTPLTHLPAGIADVTNGVAIIMP
jgi:hypothetical protein